MSHSERPASDAEQPPASATRPGSGECRYDVSLAICTYNNCDSLRETLRSLASLQAPPTLSRELIVINNNATDATEQVVRDSAASFPHPVRHVLEKNQGVAHARNAAVREARGTYLYFIDDDVTVDPGWLLAMQACFLESEADAVGSRIERAWSCEQPSWYSDEIGGCLIAQDFGSRRTPRIQEHPHLVTASIGFRRSVFSRYGMFRSELGRRGRSLVGGEDSEFYRRLLRAGAKVMYEPSAVAFHKVDETRVSKPYMRRWFREVGLTRGHLIPWRWYHRLTLAPLWVWRQTAAAYLRHLMARLRNADERERLASELWCLHFTAVFRERMVHWLPLRLDLRVCVFGLGREEQPSRRDEAPQEDGDSMTTAPGGGD